MSSRETRPDRSLRTFVLSMTTGFLLFVLPGENRAQPELPIVPDAEVTADGLHPLDPAIMGAAWVRPDVDLSDYTRVYPMRTAIQFRDVPDRRHNSRSIETATAFHVNAPRQAQLRELFEASFNDALSSVRAFEKTDELGRDVILVQGILTDVISGVPPYSPGSTVTNIKWPWEANIVLEVRDAMSYTVLARTVERQRVDGPVDASMVDALTPSIVDGWTQLLVTRLETLRSFYPTRLRRLGEHGTEQPEPISP